MQLTIPYQWTALDLTTKSNGDICLELANDANLRMHLLAELMDVSFYSEFIDAIGIEEFDNLVNYRNTKYEE